MVIELQSVAVCQACGHMQRHSRTAFSRLPIPVFDTHDSITEITFSHVKIQTIHGDQLGKSYIVSLLLPILQKVTEHKTRFFRSMCVEIDIHVAIFILVRMLNDQLFNSVDRGVVLLLWIQVIPIQVVCFSVQAVIAS